MAAIVAIAARAARLRALRRGRVTGAAETALLGFFALRRRSGSLLWRSRLGRCGQGLLLSDSGRFFGGSLFGAAILFGAAALLLVGRALRPFLAAAGILERGHARFFGLTQQARLHLHARGDFVACRRTASDGRGRLGGRLGRFGNRS